MVPLLAVIIHETISSIRRVPNHPSKSPSQPVPVRTLMLTAHQIGIEFSEIRLNSKGISGQSCLSGQGALTVQSECTPPPSLRTPSTDCAHE